jgi:uncharacterized membrane protein (DUF106 family)
LSSGKCKAWLCLAFKSCVIRKQSMIVILIQSYARNWFCPSNSVACGWIFMHFLSDFLAARDAHRNLMCWCIIIMNVIIAFYATACWWCSCFLCNMNGSFITMPHGDTDLPTKVISHIMHNCNMPTTHNLLSWTLSSMQDIVC